MSKDRHQQVGALFLQARELPLDDRASFFDEACAVDAELRAEVESLLDHGFRRTRASNQRPRYSAGLSWRPKSMFTSMLHRNLSILPCKTDLWCGLLEDSITSGNGTSCGLIDTAQESVD